MIRSFALISTVYLFVLEPPTIIKFSRVTDFNGQMHRAKIMLHKCPSICNVLSFCYFFLKPLLVVFLQVVEVELAGNEASSYEVTDCKMASWMIILLAIAGAVGLFLMLLACCCVSYISLPCLQRYKSSYD